MIIPPPLNTKERESHDISGLRVLYLLCEDMGIANEDYIQQAFLFLRRLVGKVNFMSEFNILQNYIEIKKLDKIKIETENFEKWAKQVTESQLFKVDSSKN